MSDLTNRQQVWLEHYLICWNATEAARKAKYSKPRQSGYENLTKPYIQDAIRARLAENKMSADESLARLSAYAKADMSDFLTVIGHSAYLDMSKAQSAGKLFLVKKYRTTNYGYEVELHDPLRALELIARHYGLLSGEGDPDGDSIPLLPEAVELMDQLGIDKQQLAAGVLRLLKKVAEVELGERAMIE